MCYLFPPPVASPLVNVTPSRPRPHYEGTTLDLTCTIQLTLTGVNTDVMLERDFSGTTDILSNPMEEIIEMSVTFNPLEMKDGGMYPCIAIINSIPNSEFIVTELVQYTYTLTVDGMAADTNVLSYQIIVYNILYVLCI